MKITFLLGNGFDLNLGLQTSYNQFYEYYLDQSSTDGDVAALKLAIKEDIATWSDLEVKLGEYTSELNEVSVYRKLRADILKHLLEYLRKEQLKMDALTIDRDKLFNDFLSPDRYVVQSEQSNISKLKQIQKNSKNEIRIFTFNYTNSVQKLLGDIKLADTMQSSSGSSAVFQAIEHIHGSIDSRPVMGVNDIEQIANVDFRSSEEAVECLVKPLHNELLGHTRDAYCSQYIRASNLICVHGSSIGITDKKWWVDIANALGDNCRVIIFHHCDPIDPIESFLEIQERRRVKNEFLSHAGFSDDQREKKKEYVHVCVNASIFSMIKPK